MTDITIIIPIHKLDNKDEYALFKKALESVEENVNTYTYGKLSVLVVLTSAFYDNEKKLKKITDIINKHMSSEDSVSIEVVRNDGRSDFCSQVNFGVEKVNTDYFSILEFDDEYTHNWFKMAHDYFYGNEDVSVFLPINVQFNTEKSLWQYGNELAWAASMSEELGFIDSECLKVSTAFNLTGGIFNTTDFKTICGLKSSIEVAFNYEFLLRLAKKNLKIFIVPKEGYKHCVGRKGSLTDYYADKMSDEEAKKWFALAKAESDYTEDRHKGIENSDSLGSEE